MQKKNCNLCILLIKNFQKYIINIIYSKKYEIDPQKKKIQLTIKKMYQLFEKNTRF